MLKNLREYISDNELKVTILDKRVNILNFDKLRDISDKEVSVVKNNKKIKIIGKNLKLNKMLDNEILVIGIIKRVELDNE